MLCNAAAPVDADFATFTDVYLCSLPIILVLTGELNVLELVQDFRHACGGFGQHGLHWDAHHKCYMLLELLHAAEVTFACMYIFIVPLGFRPASSD